MPKPRSTFAKTVSTGSAGIATAPPVPVVRQFLAAAALIGLAGIAYSNSFGVPFLFDDIPAIVANPSIRSLWPLGDVLLPDIAGGVTTAGRPLVNLTLALNYQISGLAVWSYHVTNLLLHTCAALLLFGFVRRTLEMPSLHAQISRRSGFWISLGAATLWMLHPLQTAAVTYIVQRAEVLVSVCFLLTLYAFVRGAASTQPRRWFVLAVLACALGMASKEVMAVAPIVVLFYDRTFVAGSFSVAWRRHRIVHSALAATWLLLAALVFGTAGRGDTAGFGAAVTPFHYALTQAHAIVRYLGLTVWPAGLTFDYGTVVIRKIADVWLQLLVISSLLGAVAYAYWRRPKLGFIGFWFFALLAPSSSIVPIASQTMAEHRLYLALAAPVIAFAIALHAWLGRHSVWPIAALSGLALAATLERNTDYQSEFTIWRDTVQKRPFSARAHHNLGQAAFTAGDTAGAIGHYQRALELEPASSETHYNHGVALARLQRWPEAAAAYHEAIRLQPEHAEAHNNLGTAWLARGDPRRAAEHYQRAVELKPAYGDAHSNLCNALIDLGRVQDAIRHGKEAVQLVPDSATAAYNLGNAFAQAGRFDEARQAFERAVVLAPNHAGAWNNLGNVHLELQQWVEAATAYERALSYRRDLLPARQNLIQLLARLNRTEEAIQHCRILVELTPHDPAARAELARLLNMPRASGGR
jgi:protein O-mannosyl-transferase